MLEDCTKYYNIYLILYNIYLLSIAQNINFLEHCDHSNIIISITVEFLKMFCRGIGTHEADGATTSQNLRVPTYVSKKKPYFLSSTNFLHQKRPFLMSLHIANYEFQYHKKSSQVHSLIK